VGTKYAGLLRIDGETGIYNVYYEDILEGSITSLCYSYDRHLLWIGTDKGLYSYSYQDDKFTRYTNNTQDSASINNNSINVVYITGDGSLWVGTNNGLEKYDKQTGEFIHYFQDRPSLILLMQCREYI
jgi:ligand-binding sensor domain-containing protein